MNDSSFLSRMLKIARRLSPGFLILGLSLIGWASYHIYTLPNPAPVSIEMPERQSKLIAFASDSVNAVNEPEIATHIGPATATQTEKKEKTTTQTQKETKDPAVHEILYPIRPRVGENIGNLILPAINQVLPIVHGTDEDELGRGIGHFAGSVLPGEKDNSVLSGHRDTVFKELGQLEITDQLIVETSAGIFTYEIKEIKIVSRDDKSIITPTNSAVLTITTCYPFDFIGSSPDRYILIAHLVSSE